MRFRPLLLLASAGLLSPGLVAAAPGAPVGAWRSAPSPATPVASDHTATLLPSGKVLVVGGVRPGDYAETHGAAQLYDPVAGGWSPIGAMGTARSHHTATPLGGGRVLVVGGMSGSHAHGASAASAELYDAATDGWHSAGSMRTGRFGHTATLLPSGKVLVAGGLVPGKSGQLTYSDSAELYDPASGAWAPAKSMPAPHAEHTATLLSNGTVLVAAGHRTTGPAEPALRDAQLYDPASDTWKTVPSLMRTARAGHTATLLPDGDVLLLGGSTQKDHGGGGHPTASAELYDHRTGTWRAAPSLASPRLAHTATLLLSGKVVVVGGLREEDDRRRVHPVESAELYDARSGSVDAGAITAPSSTSGRTMRSWIYGGHHTATLLATEPCGGLCGSLLVVGGSGKTAAQLYAPPGPLPGPGSPEAEAGAAPLGDQPEADAEATESNDPATVDDFASRAASKSSPSSGLPRAVTLALWAAASLVILAAAVLVWGRVLARRE